MIAKLLDCTLEEYREDRVGLGETPTLNYSTAKTILAKSALHAWWEHPKGGGAGKRVSKQMDGGSIQHAILLSKGAKAQIVEANDWRTNKAKAERDEARAKGLIPLLPKEYEQAMAAATQVMSQLNERGISLEGHTEQAMIWEEDGVACRGMMDLFQPAPIHMVTELKITDLSLSNRSLERLIINMGYDLQAAVYCSGVNAITGERPKFRWIFAEAKEPYCVVVAEPSDLLLELGARKWEKARNIWKACLASGVWTGYEATQEINPPLWSLREYEVSVYPETEVIGAEYADTPDDSEMWW